MSKTPDYSKATNAAYNALENYNGPYPKVDIFGIISSLPNISIHTYSETAKRFGLTFFRFLSLASSEHGYTVYNQTKNKWIIYYNDLKDECTIRFTLAHELGHIALEHTEDNDVARCEADCFARNFLCPVPLRIGYGLTTVDEYCECFNISEPMATATIHLNSSDIYYITERNFSNIDNNAYCYLTGCTLAELYGL